MTCVQESVRVSDGAGRRTRLGFEARPSCCGGRWEESTWPRLRYARCVCVKCVIRTSADVVRAGRNVEDGSRLQVVRSFVRSTGRHCACTCYSNDQQPCIPTQSRHGTATASAIGAYPAHPSSCHVFSSDGAPSARLQALPSIRARPRRRVAHRAQPAHTAHEAVALVERADRLEAPVNCQHGP